MPDQQGEPSPPIGARLVIELSEDAVHELFAWLTGLSHIGLRADTWFTRPGERPPRENQEPAAAV